MLTDEGRASTAESTAIDGYIWNVMLDAERCQRYYARLADRYRRMNFGLNVAVVLSSLGAATVLLLEQPAWISALLFLLIAAGTTWGMFSEFSRKAAVASSVSKQCDEIASDTKRLWRRLDRMDETARIMQLDARLREVTHVGFDIDDKLNERCEEDARRVAAGEFGHEGDGAVATATSSTSQPASASGTTS